MKLTLINMFTFRFNVYHIPYHLNVTNKGFQIRYNTLNCGDSSNNVCNTGGEDNGIDIFRNYCIKQLVSLYYNWL